MENDPQWHRYTAQLCDCSAIGLTLDVSRMGLEAGWLERMAPAMERAHRAMAELEAGAVANPDEGRRVGHYWLRAPHLAPEEPIRSAIEQARERIRRFAADVHTGRVRPSRAERFTDLLLIGIGGSVLGPQLVSEALGGPGDRMRVHFMDNTDPQGILGLLGRLRGQLGSTLTAVVSKSGTTPETRNGMVLTEAAYAGQELAFARHAVAVTGEGSELDRRAEAQGWLLRLPMWDWVGGRTSETGPVGLLPAALQGLDTDALLRGAAACDQVTREPETARNPAALMALMWHHATGGRGSRDMVVLPYRDRLLLLSRYLQQLIMESLGKETDLEGRRVEQGLTVYGNKGSTDQHAYVQQLRDGVHNFFVTFIHVLEDGVEPAAQRVEEAVTAGDYLHGLLLGTRDALWEKARPSLTLQVERLDAFHLGVLIALFERTVGLYAALVGINAYHQPGVEAGKRVAAELLALQREVEAAVARAEGPATAVEVARSVGRAGEVERVHHLLRHLAANGRVQSDGGAIPERRYGPRS